MNSKHLNGLTVISIADGEKLGAIERIHIDPAEKRIVGFSLKHHPGLLGLDPAEQPELIDVDDVHALGPDAMTVTDKSALRGDQTRARYDTLTDLEELSKHKVVTEGGTYVGQVASADLDPTSFRLERIEVSPGFFKSHVEVPIDQVINIGGELIVVDDAVCAPAPAAADSEEERRFVVGDVDPAAER